MVGMENFLPDLPEGEDDITYSRYQQDLKEQHNLRKESRDKSVISNLMNKTFARRRHLLITELIQLKTLIADYPLCAVRNRYIRFACSYVYAPKMKTLWLLKEAFSYRFFSPLSVYIF